MLGTVRVRVQGARAIDLHGDRYLDLAVVAEGAAEAAGVRVPAALLPGHPEPGQRLELELLMGQVQAVRSVTD
jgi:hypothetical protein